MLTAKSEVLDKNLKFLNKFVPQVSRLFRLATGQNVFFRNIKTLNYSSPPPRLTRIVIKITHRKDENTAGAGISPLCFQL
jgi:hypothetical protein